MTAPAPIVWDNHGCLPLRPGDTDFLPQLRRYRDAGVNVVSINVGFDLTSIESNFRMLAHFRDWLRQHADEYLLVTSTGSVHAAKATGKLAVTFDLEGARALGGQLSLVRLYYDLGVRWMLVAYNHNNEVGGGCQDDDGGLTDFGREVVDEMAAVGMVVCCSHTGYRTARDVMDHSSRPVILSHSNPRSLCDHPRNVTDDVIKACAATGGVIGINGVGAFLGANDASVSRIAAHIDYTVDLVGPEHVGIGLDYCFDQAEVAAFVKSNPQAFPPALGYAAGMRFASPECFPEIAQNLLDRGYSPLAIDQIMGMNFLRVAEQVWR